MYTSADLELDTYVKNFSVASCVAIKITNSKNLYGLGNKNMHTIFCSLTMNLANYQYFYAKKMAKKPFMSNHLRL